MSPFIARKEYLGDGVYVVHDGWMLWLTTEAGPGIVTNKIALEPEVYAALLRYVETLRAANPPEAGE